MNRSLFAFVIMLTTLVAHGGENLIDYLQLESGGVGVRAVKLSALQVIACDSNAPNYYAANALLAAYYIHANDNDAQFTNSYRHAVEALKSPSTGWEKIYAGLALATIEGSCYRQNYTNQIKTIQAVLQVIGISNWESQDNPVYSLLKINTITFGTESIRNILILQLVNAYCRTDQAGSAELIIKNITDVEIAQNAQNLIMLEKKGRAERDRRAKEGNQKDEL